MSMLKYFMAHYTLFYRFLYLFSCEREIVAHHSKRLVVGNATLVDTQPKSIDVICTPNVICMF